MKVLLSLFFSIATTFVTTCGTAGAQDHSEWTGPPHRPRILNSQAAHASRVSPNAIAFDVGFYHLTLDLARERDPQLIGRLRIEGRALAPLDTLVFDLSSAMTLDGVETVTANQLPYVHQDDVISIVLPARLEIGQFFALDITYRGNPDMEESGVFEMGVRNAGDSYAWTLSEPHGSKQWWPAENHPSDKADSVRVTVTVQEPLIVASNGLLEAEVHHGDGTVTFDWMHRYPIASYLVSIAAGDYLRIVETYTRPDELALEFGEASFPIEHYSFRDVPAFEGINDASGWRLTSEAMAVLEGWFGPYPFENEKYGNAHVTFRGGMEHQTISSMGNIGIELISHELSHQWFGDKLTPSSWQDLWLNEGFATLGEMLVFDSNPDFAEVGSFLKDLYYERARLFSGKLLLADTANAAEMFSFPRVYAKGWMVLRMIRLVTGEDVFRQILRAYASDPNLAYSGARSEDFQAVVENVTERSFETFFEQWVFQGRGFPVYQTHIEDISTPSSPRARVTINQIQQPDESNTPVFEMPVWLAIQTTNGEEMVLVQNALREQIYELDVLGSPISVTLDPDRWILRGETVLVTSLEDPDVSGKEMHVDVFPNPTSHRIEFTIEAPLGSVPVAVLYDVLGREIMTQVLPSGAGSRQRIVLDGLNLASGMYVLRLHDGRSVVDKTIVVQR